MIERFTFAEGIALFPEIYKNTNVGLILISPPGVNNLFIEKKNHGTYFTVVLSTVVKYKNRPLGGFKYFKDLDGKKKTIKVFKTREEINIQYVRESKPITIEYFEISEEYAKRKINIA